MSFSLTELNCFIYLFLIVDIAGVQLDDLIYKHILPAHYLPLSLHSVLLAAVPPTLILQSLPPHPFSSLRTPAHPLRYDCLTSLL